MSEPTESLPVKYLGKFYFTNKTATFKDVTLQLCNVVKIRVKSYKKEVKATYKINEETINNGYKAFFIGLLLAYFGRKVDVLVLISGITILASGALIYYYYYERRKYKDRISNFYGLFFECNAGLDEVLWFDHPKDVADLFDRITNSMNEPEPTSFIATFNQSNIEIRDSKNIVIDSNIQGDEVVIGNK